jgi:hypothetical protein
MKENEILSEIHRVREEIARECGNDVREIFRRMRAQTEQLKAQGVRVEAPAPRERPAATYALHDKPGEKPK